MTIQDLVDKQAAIIAARDATIAVLKAAADQRWRLREELEQLVGFGFGDSGDPDKCEEAIRKIADWKTELRRRIIADRDNEIKLGKFTAGWAWATSTEKLIEDKFNAILEGFGL